MFRVRAKRVLGFRVWGLGERFLMFRLAAKGFRHLGFRV